MPFGNLGFGCDSLRDAGVTCLQCGRGFLYWSKTTLFLGDLGRNFEKALMDRVMATQAQLEKGEAGTWSWEELSSVGSKAASVMTGAKQTELQKVAADAQSRAANESVAKRTSLLHSSAAALANADAISRKLADDLERVWADSPRTELVADEAKVDLRQVIPRVFNRMVTFCADLAVDSEECKGIIETLAKLSSGMAEAIPEYFLVFFPSCSECCFLWKCLKTLSLDRMSEIVC
eukprot:6465604-Amphidinium_carterae.4